MAYHTRNKHRFFQLLQGEVALRRVQIAAAVRCLRARTTIILMPGMFWYLSTWSLRVEPGKVSPPIAMPEGEGEGSQ